MGFLGEKYLDDFLQKYSVYIFKIEPKWIFRHDEGVIP